LIIYEKAKLHKAEEQGNLAWPCNYSIQTSHRLLYYHDLFERMQSGGQVLPGDIHPFWWYDRTKASTIDAFEGPNGLSILDPAIVRRKGRPKGSRGKGKNDGPQGIYILFKISQFIVVFY
jgi:hypothetical protein